MTDRILCPPEHKHGLTGTCYNNHRCGCQNCKDGRADHAREVTRLKAYGRYDNGFVDVGPILDHINMLRAFGLGRRRIAEMAGVTSSVIECILYTRRGSKNRPRPKAPSSRIANHNAAKILAVRPDIDGLGGKAIIPSRGAHRRVQALNAIGWSLARIADRLGSSPESFGLMMSRDTISAGQHRRIAALYEDLQFVVPPHANGHELQVYTRSINRARLNGWPVPMAWDDIDNDPEPAVAAHDTTVDEIALELALAGESVRLNHAEKLEAVRRMHPKKWSNDLIAEHLGCEERTVLRLRKELGLPGWPQNDVIDRIAA